MDDLTRWERAVEAAAKAIYMDDPAYTEEMWQAMKPEHRLVWRSYAAAALRAALPALFEARQWEGWDSFADALAINEYRIWLDAHRRALEAEASHD